MGFIDQNYGIEQTTPLMTDKYHFTTAYAYWLEGRADNPAVFYMFGRKEAGGSGYTVAAGLEGVIDIVKRWQEHGLTKQDADYLRSLKTPKGERQFPDEFVDYLSQMKFKLKIDAVPEGHVFFPQEPVLRVEGPMAQVKMLESVALCLVNGHSAYATHAARLQDVLSREMENGSPTGSASVQGLRRGPGLGAAIEASRSLGLGGYSSTSTGTAAKFFAQAFAGTMDHAWVMTHSAEVGELTYRDLLDLQKTGKTDELKQALKNDAFRSFAFAHPESGILLVDTYDPIEGLENAITVIKELRAEGLGAHYGVRFDSGDIVKYSKLALRRFAEEGFVDGLDAAAVKKMTDADLLKHADKCSIFCAAADGIDEYSAQKMREDGAFYSAWGIGTGGSHVPPLGLVYKAAALYMDVLDGKPAPEGAEMTPVMKVAAHAPVKSSNPGRINARRFYDDNGKLAQVVVYDERLGLAADGKQINLRNFADVKNAPANMVQKDLLVPVFDADGKYVYQAPAQKETFPGSGVMTTDLSAMAKIVREQLETLPDDVRCVSKKPEDVLKDRLLALFNKAQQAGEDTLNVDIKSLTDALPAEAKRIPVYLDAGLFAQRRDCENKHLAQGGNKTGVDSYAERFETGASDMPAVQKQKRPRVGGK